MSNQVHGFLVDRLIIEARKWIPDDATYKDIEDYVYHGCKGADVEIFTVSPGAADIYQVEQAASLFDVGLTAADRDYDFGWEAVEAKANEISDALSAEFKKAGLPGTIYFGQDDNDGSYGLRYHVALEALPNVTIPAGEQGDAMSTTPCWDDFALSYNPFPVCPWCGAEVRDAWELDLRNDGQSVETDCDKCDRLMVVFVHHAVTYSTRKTKEG